MRLIAAWMPIESVTRRPFSWMTNSALVTSKSTHQSKTKTAKDDRDGAIAGYESAYQTLLDATNKTYQGTVKAENDKYSDGMLAASTAKSKAYQTAADRNPSYPYFWHP